MPKPNILLLMCDQFRGDCLSIQGHPDVQTPYLDSIGHRGVIFDNAYSATPSCIPARAALLTGRSQEKHGRIGYEDGIDWNYQHTLPEEFSNSGYQTQCVGKMHVHPPRLTLGFQNVKLHDGYLGCYRNDQIPHYMHQDVCDDYLFDLKRELGPQADITATGPECNSWIVHPWIYEERLHPTNWVVDQSLRFLDTRDRSKPFFLMSSFVRPHQPLDPPQAYFDLYKNRQPKPPVQGDWNRTDLTTEHQYQYDSIYGTANKSLQQDARAAYYASITHIDHQIGRILLKLQEQNVLEDTVILFVSDHGEMLFDHSLWRKVFPYQGSIHIPLMISPGSNVLPFKAHHSDEVVELRDIMPTLLELCKIPIPASVDGRSLVSTMQEKNTVREYLHGEHSFHDNLSHHYIVTKNDKYIWYSQTGQEQYFDLMHDPHENHDAIHDEHVQKRIEALRNILIQELNNRPEGYSNGENLIVGQSAQNWIDPLESD